MSKMLSSWKEIAQFFGKGVRTVQRWEKTLDLPIHRPPGAPSNVVLARTSDLEEWMHRGPSMRAATEKPSTRSFADQKLVSAVSDLEAEVKVLEQHFGLAQKAGTEENVEDIAARLRTATQSLHALVEQVNRRPMAA